MEMLAAFEDKGVEFQITCVAASTDVKERQRQWDFLKGKRQKQGSMWVMGGDFNDILNNDGKNGGRRRQENNFYDFKSFMSDMEMEDIKYKGDTFT